jgi:hypothetical protein
VSQYTIEGIETPVSSANAPAPVAAGSFALTLNSAALDSPPVAAWELVNGSAPIELPITQTDSGYQVLLDQPFEHMAAILVEMQWDNPDDVDVVQ